MRGFVLRSGRGLLALALGLGLVALGAVGCATPDPDNMSARPWNTPKAWESGIPSGLLEGR